MFYHEFCTKTIYTMLQMNVSKEQLNNSIFTYSIANGLIGQYSETHISNGKEFKFWNLNFHTKKYNGLKIWSNIFSSCEAAKLSFEIEEGNIKYNKQNNNAPFYEHIEPRNITYKKLIDLKESGNFTENDVKSILEQSKLIMLTYNQKEFLDKKPNNHFNDQDVEIIENWRKNGKITNEDADEAIISMKSKNKYLSTNQNGTKFARFAHIYRLGVKSFFYKGITYSDDEAINGFNKYINDNSHSIN